MPHPTSQLVKAIRQAQKRGMSFGDIAKASETTTATISRIVAGKQDPTLATASRIAAALGKKIFLK